MPREDETEQKLATIDNLNDVTDKPTEEKNEMSEIESTMKDCHINMEENLFYKVIKNDDGKFLDCVALKGIKAGTIILKEKPQFVPKMYTKWDNAVMIEMLEIDPDYLSSLLNSYFSMSKSCQEEFWNLKNQYLNPNSLYDHHVPDDPKKYEYLDPNILYNHKRNYLYWKRSCLEEKGRSLAKKFNVSSDFILEIICIFVSNFQRTNENAVLSINASKFNHSCGGANAELFDTEDGDIEITTTSKVEIGEQISIHYNHGIAMKNLKDRQEFLLNFFYIICNCQLCKTEGEMFKNDDETYEKFQQLKEESEEIKNNYQYENVLIRKLNMAERHINCMKKLYNMARNKKSPKVFIFHIVHDTFQIGAAAYSLAKKFIDYDDQEILDKMNIFQGECETLARIAHQIAKIRDGKNSTGAKVWKEIYQDFEGWQEKMKDTILGDLHYYTFAPLK